MYILVYKYVFFIILYNTTSDLYITFFMQSDDRCIRYEIKLNYFGHIFDFKSIYRRI